MLRITAKRCMATSLRNGGPDSTHTVSEPGRSNGRALRALPLRRTVQFEEIDSRVNKFGLISVKRVQYNVPSRSVGHRLNVRQHTLQATR